MRIDQTESRLITQWNFANPDTMGQNKLSVLVRCPYGLCMQELFFGGKRCQRFQLPWAAAMSPSVSVSPQNISLSAHCWRLGWDWLERDLSASTHATRELSGSSDISLSLWNLPVSRPLHVDGGGRWTTGWKCRASAIQLHLGQLRGKKSCPRCDSNPRHSVL